MTNFYNREDVLEQINDNIFQRSVARQCLYIDEMPENALPIYETDTHNVELHPHDVLCNVSGISEEDLIKQVSNFYINYENELFYNQIININTNIIKQTDNSIQELISLGIKETEKPGCPHHCILGNEKTIKKHEEIIKSFTEFTEEKKRELIMSGDYSSYYFAKLISFDLFPDNCLIFLPQPEYLGVCCIAKGLNYNETISSYNIKEEISIMNQEFVVKLLLNE